jgi:hypothetical protein
MQFLHDEACNLRARKQKRQLGRVQQLEAAGLIGDVAVRVVADSGHTGLEAVDRIVQQLIGERDQLEPAGGLALDELCERHEGARIKPMRARRVGGIAQHPRLGAARSAAGKPRRDEAGAGQRSQQRAPCRVDGSIPRVLRHWCRFVFAVPERRFMIG